MTMIDLDAFPGIGARLGDRLRPLAGKAPRDVFLRHGWLAYELASGTDGCLTREDLAMLDRCLASAPPEFDAPRLLTAQAVDSSYAELLVVAGLIERFGDELAYEQEATDKGTIPDIAIQSDQAIFEVRSLGLWGPQAAVHKLANVLESLLRSNRIRGRVSLRLSTTVTIPDVRTLAASIVDRLREAFGHQRSFRFRHPLPSLEQSDGSVGQDVLSRLDPPRLVVKYEHDEHDLMVSVGPPEMVPLTGEIATELAREVNDRAHALALSPEGKSVTDHVRRLLKKKTNRQAKAGWSNFVVLVHRVDTFMPISWDIVLPDALEGDSLLQVPVESDAPPSHQVIEEAGLWRNGQNTRLTGAIGITIDLHGVVHECVSHAREGSQLSGRVRDLLGVRRGRTDGTRLPDLLAGR